MASGTDIGLAAVAALGASEATGVTDFTGLGSGGGDESDSGEGGGPPVDLSGLRAQVAGLRGAVASGGVGGGQPFDRPDTVDLSGLADAIPDVASDPTDPVTNIIGDAGRAGVTGVTTGAKDGFVDTTGIGLLGPGPLGGDGGGDGGGGGSEPFAGFENKARTGGRNIGQGLGGGAGNVLGYGIESAGNAALRPFRDQVNDIRNTLQEGPNLKEGDRLFPNDPLTNAARDVTPTDNVAPVEAAKSLVNMDGPTDSSGGGGSSTSSSSYSDITDRISSSASESGGDPSTDTSSDGDDSTDKDELDTGFKPGVGVGL
jgi:hypothetical protein